MGLDMYLSKRIYVGANYDHNKVTGKIEILRDGKPLKINLDKVTYIEESAFYWRKSNAIHNWFVSNVQKGEDDCGEYEVDYDQLLALGNTINQILTASENKQELAANLLPTASGFFFGNTDYDEYYFYSLQETKTMIDELLKEAKEYEPGKLYFEFDLIYSSSW